MNKREQQFLWVEKYRPQTIDECILPQRYKDTFKNFISQGEIPHMLLTGGPGIGKTTVAKAMCNELKVDTLVINASENGNIDTLRTTIRQFASTVSLFGGKKVVILDEADYLNPNSTQPALRNFMEEFSKNCRFILTANFANRIIEPLHSRCTTIDFVFSKQEKGVLATQYLNRIGSILDTEGVAYDKKILAELIMKYFPDFRKILNELQSFASGGTIDGKILSNVSDVKVSEVLSFLKEKEFNKMRRWVADHVDNDAVKIMASVIREGERLGVFENSFVPNAIMIYNDYDRWNAFVTDKETHLVAFFTQLMMEGEFK